MTALHLQSDLSSAFQREPERRDLTWHALEVATKREIAVRDALRGIEGASGWVPMYTKEVVRRGKRSVVEEQRIGLPGYVLIEVENPFRWSTVLELDHVGEPLRKAGAEPGKYHVIPSQSIAHMRALEEKNFGEMVRRPGSDPVQVGSIIMRLIAGHELKCEVKGISGGVVHAQPEGLPEYWSVDVPLNELQRA